MTKASVAALVLPLVLLAALGFASCESESRRVREVVLPELDLSGLEDGTYSGEVAYREHPYRVGVTVQDHRICRLEVAESPGEEHDLAALAVLQRVLAEQKLGVDAVSGATRSSRLYLIAAYEALTGETIEY